MKHLLTADWGEALERTIRRMVPLISVTIVTWGILHDFFSFPLQALQALWNWQPQPSASPEPLFLLQPALQPAVAPVGLLAAAVACPPRPPVAPGGGRPNPRPARRARKAKKIVEVA